MTYKEQLKLHEIKIAQHDKEIAAIRRILLQGGRMLLKLEKSQQDTDKQLKEFIKSLKGGSNGHKT